MKKGKVLIIKKGSMVRALKDSHNIKKKFIYQVLDLDETGVYILDNIGEDSYLDFDELEVVESLKVGDYVRPLYSEGIFKKDTFYQVKRFTDNDRSFIVVNGVFVVTLELSSPLFGLFPKDEPTMRIVEKDKDGSLAKSITEANKRHLKILSKRLHDLEIKSGDYVECIDDAFKSSGLNLTKGKIYKVINTNLNYGTFAKITIQENDLSVKGSYLTKRFKKVRLEDKVNDEYVECITDKYNTLIKGKIYKVLDSSIGSNSQFIEVKINENTSVYTLRKNFKPVTLKDMRDMILKKECEKVAVGMLGLESILETVNDAFDNLFMPEETKKIDKDIKILKSFKSQLVNNRHYPLHKRSHKGTRLYLDLQKAITRVIESLEEEKE